MIIGGVIGFSAILALYFGLFSKKENRIPLKKIPLSFTEACFNKIDPQYQGINSDYTLIYNVKLRKAFEIDTNKINQYKFLLGFLYCYKNRNTFTLLYDALVGNLQNIFRPKDTERVGYYALDKNGNLHELFKIQIKNYHYNGVYEYESSTFYVNNNNEEENIHDYFKNLFEQTQNTTFSNLSLTGGIKEKNDENRNLTFDLEISTSNVS